MKRHMIIVAALLLLAGGCASASTAKSPSARVSAPTTLNPDGSVPWVNEPAVEADFEVPLKPPPPAIGPTCRVSDLTATLLPWIHKSTDGEGYNPSLNASLYGYVNLTNHGAACVVKGTPTVRLLAGGTVITDIDYEPLPVDSISPVGLPARVGQASFRMDWSAPYCASPGAHVQVPGSLSVSLPGGAGTFTVPVADHTTPGCVRDEAPTAMSGLSPSPIEPFAYGSPRSRTGAMAVLRPTIVGAPKTVRPAAFIDFQVVLRNPSAQAVSITGRPGFSVELFCEGTGGRAGYNVAMLYLLNNRPITSIPAGGSATFDMHIPLTTKALPGTTFYITWRLIDVSMDAQPSAVASIPVA